MIRMIAAALLIFGMPSDPIDAYIRASRQQLDKAGLTRVTTEDGSVYWTGGKGTETLVLLHGVNDQAGTWAAVAPALANDYRLIIPDLAGHGESEPKSGPLTYALLLERLHTILAGEEKVTLVGNSMGGWISILYALDHPAKVSRLVLENASGMMWQVTAPLAPKNREEAAVMMRAVHGPDDKTPVEVLDAFLARKDQPMSRFAIADVMKHFVDPRLSSLRVPVTLIWGRHDGLLPLDYAEEMQKRIEGSKLLVIDDAAHIPHRQQPEEFVKCLKATC